MLTRQQKQQYGQILRQQIKQKQAQKRQQRLGGAQLLPSPIQPTLQVIQHSSPQSIPSQHIQSQPVVRAEPPPVDQKEILQRQWESQDYNPFGRAGSGAPNPTQNKSTPYLNPNQLQQPDRKEIFQAELAGQGPNYQQAIPIQQPTQVYTSQPSPPQQLSLINETPSWQQKYQQAQNKYSQQALLVPPINSQVSPSQVVAQSYPAYNNSGNYHQYSQQQANIMQTDPRERIISQDNEELQDMYRKGGRNLLQLQNQTANEHLVKQKQKQQMQAFLKQQMDEAERRKQLEKQKIKRQEMEEERRNRQYIELQNQRLHEEERKKQEERQRVVDENLKNLAKRKQLEEEAKQKIERERLQAERRRQQQEQAKSLQAPKEEQKQGARSINRGNAQPTSISSEDDSSSISGQSTHHRGFNTNISRDFFKNERQRQPQRAVHDRKLDIFTNQIQKMRDEINSQGEMFHREMERIKREASHAEDQKRRAQIQIQRLKLQLQKRNKETELRLMEALQRNHPDSKKRQPSQQLQDSYEEQQYVAKAPRSKPAPPAAPAYPAKMPKKNKVKEVQAEEFYEESRVGKRGDWEGSLLQESVAGTLQANSKKIPLNVGQGTKLTMSNIGQYGKEPFLYGEQRSKPLPKHPLAVPQVRHQRQYSSSAYRQNDALDMLVDSRSKPNLDSVNDDITHEIEQLLKQKSPEKNKISTAGRQVLSRGGLPYNGPNLDFNSNQNTISAAGTLDIDKVQARNDARLRQLRNLGVETINTDMDGDMSRLNDILRQY